MEVTRRIRYMAHLPWVRRMLPASVEGNPKFEILYFPEYTVQVTNLFNLI